MRKFEKRLDNEKRRFFSQKTKKASFSKALVFNRTNIQVVEKWTDSSLKPLSYVGLSTLGDNFCELHSATCIKRRIFFKKRFYVVFLLTNARPFKRALSQYFVLFGVKYTKTMKLCLKSLYAICEKRRIFVKNAHYY